MKKNLKDWSFVLVFCIFCLIYINFFTTAEVHGNSMYPTYEDGDFLLILKTKDVTYGDIVAIDSSEVGKILCKRIIGLEGDTIRITEDGLHRNDMLLKEDYINSKDWTRDTDLISEVDSDTVFVLGDNRMYSRDSRELGNLATESIKGVSIFNFTDFCSFITRDSLISLTVLSWVLLLVSSLFGYKKRQ